MASFTVTSRYNTPFRIDDTLRKVTMVDAYALEAWLRDAESAGAYGIHVEITSYAMNPYPYLYMAGVLKSARVNVVTSVPLVAAKWAVGVLRAGTPGLRCIGPNARLYNDPVKAAGASETDLDEAEYSRLFTNVKDDFSAGEHTGPYEAVEMGLADRVGIPIMDTYQTTVVTVGGVPALPLRAAERDDTDSSSGSEEEQEEQKEECACTHEGDEDHDQQPPPAKRVRTTTAAPSPITTTTPVPTTTTTAPTPTPTTALPKPKDAGTDTDSMPSLVTDDEWEMDDNADGFVAADNTRFIGFARTFLNAGVSEHNTNRALYLLERSAVEAERTGVRVPSCENVSRAVINAAFKYCGIPGKAYMKFPHTKTMTIVQRRINREFAKIVHNL